MYRKRPALLHSWTIVAFCFVGLSSWALAQNEASVVTPSIVNRLKDPDPASSAQADASVGSVSGAGTLGAAGFRITSSVLGYSFSANSPDFDYGDEIHPPLEDLDGRPLTLPHARAYWRAEPARPGEEIQTKSDPAITPVAPNVDERYYYSPHVEKVIASQTGNITLTWVKAQPKDNGDFETLKKSYNIGFGTSLQSRQVYWTEVDFEAPRVQIPTGIVQDLEILYNDRFPSTVKNEVDDGIEERVIPFGVDANLVPDTTIWFDSTLEMLRAYNLEGRVIVEYLGDPRGEAGDGVREHLGLEIIEVRRELSPVTVETVIGEQLLPSDAPGVILDDLDFTPVQKSAAGPPVAQHFVDGRSVFYGIGENLQAPDVEFYWLSEGNHTILWPELRNNYLIEWPEEVADFEAVFARPDLGTEGDVVASTYLNLIATNTPELIFQDDPTGSEASLDFQFNLSVALDPNGADQFNRSLIRLNSGNDFWYVRLYSATATHLKDLDTADAIDPDQPLEPLDPLEFHIARNVVVGQRLEPPHPSLSPGGYIDPASGDAYQEDAYIDPFSNGGIEDANRGAIIPVNANSLSRNGTRPGNKLRVWWFRKLAPPTLQADLFRPIFVPTVLGDYTISYPSNAPEIIMASNAGTGDLNSKTYSIDINDADFPGETEPGWTALPVTHTGNGGTVNVSGVDFTIASSDGARLRGGVDAPDPNPLTGDFAFDDGDGQAIILFFGGAGDLPAGDWQVELWTFDSESSLGDQIVGYRTNSTETIVQSDVAVSSDNITPAITFSFNSDGLSAYDVFIRENNAENRSRLNAVRLTQLGAPGGGAPGGIFSAIGASEGLGRIYYQNDPTKTGYNPNEEHAVMIAGHAYALRDDLNTPGVSSEPFVLLAYDDADGRPDMEVFKVLREKTIAEDPTLGKDLVFDYPAVAGRLLQAPLPLPVIPQPIIDGGSRNTEVTQAELDPVLNGPSTENLENLVHYNKFTFQDRKGATWVYRGPHQPDGGAAKKLSMQYYYPTLETFAFPNPANGNDEAPELGTIVPYLRPLGATDSPVTGTPLTITFTPQWPEETPILHFGETLAKPKFGLPQILGQTSAQLVYQQSIAVDFEAAQNSVVLHDSTINRTVELGDFSEIEELPGSVPKTNSRGKTFFQLLPSHLEDRVFFDSLIGTQGAIVFEGRFNDELAGEDYLLPNTLSETDVDALKDLCLLDDPLKTPWDTLIDNLEVTPIYRSLDDRLLEEQITYEEWLAKEGINKVIGQTIKATYGPTELPQIASPDQAVHGYYLSAIGGGSGYVTLVTGNGLLNSEEGEPVQMHVFRVGEKLYRGELKPLVAANPLSESVAVQHTGDFAGNPNGYEFEWKMAPPVNGLAPAVAKFKMVNLGSSLASADLFRNVSTTEGVVDWGTATSTVIPFSETIYPAGADRTVPGLRVTSTLDFSNEITGEDKLNKVFVSVRLGGGDGAIVNINGVEAIRYQALSDEDSETAASIPTDSQVFLTAGNDLVVFELPARFFDAAAANDFEVLLSTSNTSDTESIFDLRVSIQVKEDLSSNYRPFVMEKGKNRHVVSGSGIDTLGDNYYIMRYRPLKGHALYRAVDPKIWSDWTNPALVEGWIKRVLAGINPFNQRLSDFFENAVDTNVSIVSQAGARWEGDVALNLQAVSEAGLIEIYETVLKRGINLSINGTPAVDYAPANDALLLAAGYLNDLYVALGNEAFADAANPTVHFDAQALGTLGDAASTQGFEGTFRSTSTARFSFQGQVPTLLDEELALLRGRDDFLSPSIETPPVYNRMFWNYTRGIDAGELIYALNYNITEQSDGVADGKVDAEDAARMFPQAHGDAYGHYLTAVKNYYRLLTDPEFTWGTRIEAVNVLGQPVSIDYFDERKFAASAAALARTANQVISLERRKAFQAGAEGWQNLTDGRENDRTGTTRYWGVDDWAARGGQGSYFHWLVGNAIVPAEDLVNEGIQKIDRSTVPELDAIAKAAEQIQKQIEAADSRVNPLNLSNDSLLFDISPADLADGETHFEQIYKRATTALNNANAVFERAADSTRLLRSTENQNQNLTQIVDDEETAFIAMLIDIFGQPYPSDVGPGKFFPQGYTGPDLIRYMAIDRPFEIFAKSKLFSYDGGTREFTLNVKDSGLIDSINDRDLFTILDVRDEVEDDGDIVTYRLREDQGPYIIADPAMGSRPSLGSIQTALNDVRLAEEQLYVGLASMDSARKGLFSNLDGLETEMAERSGLKSADLAFSTAKFIYNELIVAIEVIQKSLKLVEKTRQQIVGASVKSLPTVVGLSSDVGAPARAAILAADIAAATPLTAADIAAQQAEAAADFVFISAEKALEIAKISVEEKAYLRAQIAKVKSLYAASYARTREVDALAVAYTRAIENYRTELANGQTVLANREVFRRRAAAAIQGYRTRDIAFRTFRTEALEEYQTLLDWASRYAFLAAQAYDYETGLLGSTDGQAFLGDIISSRALGVVGPNGEPTLSASATGDAGLSGLLAKLKGDYDVVKGRLGFNNPESNGTTFSLRRELFRIPDTPDGDTAWQQALEGLVTTDLLTDADIATHAMQLGGTDVSSQPGFLLSFRSVIEDGKNFFGKPLLAGDSTYTTSNFATKISSLGVVFEGYHGMAPCPLCLQGHDHGDALSATPYVYLIPAGLDSMRTPPLGDGSPLREWHVQDYAMPLPFDLGDLEPSNEAVQRTSDGLRASFRSPRRHAAFRATDIVDYFYTNLASDYTSSRLVGRSVANTNWKIAIPAKSLLADESEGITRFIRSVKDIKLHLKTYSYAGN